MRVVHWTLTNKSGMHRVAESISEGEKKLGIDSIIANPQDEKTWIWDADINVSHTHVPDVVSHKNKNPIIWVGHGSPEHVFQTSVELAIGYGHSDSWMLCQNWLRRAHACVTFWPRHQKIWQSMCQRGREIDLVTLGVDKSFWKPVQSRGKFDGEPSLFTCENPHYVKWPLPLLFAWGAFIRPELPKAKLHAIYLPTDMHRWFFTLTNSNGTTYGSHMSSSTFNHEELRNAFNSVDYHIGLVLKGEFNRVSLEANASGCKTISYRGNPYSDFWIDEGDEFEYLIPQLMKILRGETEPRKDKIAVPDISETIQGFQAIYERFGKAGSGSLSPVLPKKKRRK